MTIYPIYIDIINKCIFNLCIFVCADYTTLYRVQGLQSRDRTRERDFG